MAHFSTPTGTKDILPDDWPYWDVVLGHAREVATLFGYRRIETPTFADVSLFARTSGEGSDIVTKEMYTFRHGSDELALRPEGTAPVVRAYLQHGMRKLPQPVKLYYIERMYRAESPQAGRLREHHQFGCEAIGVADAYVDVEMIALLDVFYSRIGLTDLSLHVNNIGDQACRPGYIAELVRYFEQRRDRLSSLDRERLERNPLRVLDSKESFSQEVIEGAPSIEAYLCADCRAHWRKLRSGLDALGIAYEVDHRLVRGLDYYTRTAFEFMPRTAGAQSVVGAGGRYDALSEAMGGPPVPGVGFGSGIERLVLNMREQGVEVPQQPPPRVSIVHVGPGAEEAALRLASALRKACVPVTMTFGERSLKAQLRHANSVGARYAAIIGEDELRQNAVTLRDLLEGSQRVVGFDDVSGAI